MATAKNSKPKASTPSNAKTLAVTEDKTKSRERLLAEVGLSSLVSNANTASEYAKGIVGVIGLTEAVDIFRDKASKLNSGDLSELEATLAAQAATLDVMFNELARRAALNMGTYLNPTETYLRMALKAQSQCRTTIETLAEIKYPRNATFIKQANIAGQQQVNNGGANNESSTRTHAHGKSLNQSNELLEAQHGERLDTGTAATASGNDTQVEAVGTVNRGKDTGRQGKVGQ